MLPHWATFRVVNLFCPSKDAAPSTPATNPYAAFQVNFQLRGGVSQWIVNMVNVFGRAGGFKTIRDELMQADQPLFRTRALLRPIFEVKDVLTEDFLNWFAAILAPIVAQVYLPPLHSPAGLKRA